MREYLAATVRPTVQPVVLVLAAGCVGVKSPALLGGWIGLFRYHVRALPPAPKSNSVIRTSVLSSSSSRSRPSVRMWSGTLDQLRVAVPFVEADERGRGTQAHEHLERGGGGAVYR